MNKVREWVNGACKSPDRIIRRMSDVLRIHTIKSCTSEHAIGKVHWTYSSSRSIPGASAP